MLRMSQSFSYVVQATEERRKNATLKKTLDWIELDLDRSLVSDPPTGSGRPA
jgi:hypothetical protein